ncbi:hypothetical protein DESUT3_02440 [Desulfuromonas versatilis]|uniref:AB hydrolase-1 domain-containing protein n=1 Tax=Desulfuromonas versatilis TaxID=2802975 RepID=A0ABN6DSQ4_9BACT|nr:alpha/beta hydrolase [Desulfuromonas versatilis]BCR03175.1 hypothetical protein DESUT3_02440 [Desulfuromonas versatilis]
MNRILTLLFFILLLGAGPGEGQTSPPPAAPAALPQGFSQQMVLEPIFQSRALILEGGKEHEQSVILVHGLGDLAARTWDGLLPVLAEQYHVVAFDLPGFGRSEKKNALYSPARYAAFLQWVAARYVDGPFHLIGHSLGGAVSLYFAGTYPKGLGKLVLADVAGVLHKAVITTHYLQPDLKERWPLAPSRPLELLDGLIGSTVRGLEGLPLDPDILLENEALRARALGGDPGKIAALALVQSNFGPILPQVAAPTLLLWGVEDQVTPLRTGVLLAGTLANARLERIPQAGHVPMREQPALFNRAVLDFLAQPPPAANSPDPPGNRDVACRDQEGFELSGSYRGVTLSNCRNARLVGVSAASLEIVNSTVSLEDCRILGQERGMTAVNSKITATALTVEAQQALDCANSTLDLAGARLKGTETAVKSRSKTTILFSASQVQSGSRQFHPHGKYTLGPQDPL